MLHNPWEIQEITKGDEDQTFSHIMLYCAAEMCVHKFIAAIANAV
jgi:hypothetical protein